jgi:hypothetical protein
MGVKSSICSRHSLCSSRRKMRESGSSASKLCDYGRRAIEQSIDPPIVARTNCRPGPCGGAILGGPPITFHRFGEIPRSSSAACNDSASSLRVDLTARNCMVGCPVNRAAKLWMRRFVNLRCRLPNPHAGGGRPAEAARLRRTLRRLPEFVKSTWLSRPANSHLSSQPNK